MKREIFKILLFAIGLFTAAKAYALPAVSISYQQMKLIENEIENIIIEEDLEHLIELKAPNLSNSNYEVKNKKLKAIILGIALGHFGVHRIYLGTKAIVPVAYSITLGGGFGILPLVDVITLISTKDISKYENNDKIIMWL